MSADIVDNKELLAFIERVESIEERMDADKEDRKEVYSEMKGSGFCTKTVRKIIKNRKADRQKLREAQEIYDTYATAIGLDV